ncbi:S53 family peptidase [Dyella tabacisoli]|uniref:Peptidase S53 n=1 Tax=Dyella tabacisoli TaxID=2282381 RepID=A0A369UHN4_9GAMM|nr:S53 family peptidase [Dyella tabacisoli]RDD80081.1 peptidase S53 [Dyella tabacisoli]
MFTQLHRKSLTTALALLLCGVAGTSAARDVRPALDMGTANTAQTVNVTLVLNLHHQEALENYVYRTVTPGDPAYHKFLSTAEFARQYGATDDEIAQVQAFLKHNGIATTEVTANHLAIKTRGTISQFNNAFQTTIRDYQSSEGSHFHRPSREPVLPSALAGTVVMAAGLSTEAKYVSHHMHSSLASPQLTKLAPMANGLLTNKAATNGTATGVPGQYTVGDVANFYNINPLYNAGVTGKGSTIGIVTLADFYPADAYSYWNMIGLVTKPNRITQMHVDGGGVISGAAGSGETSLDVEQSGGLAPFADVLVYDAPNTDAGFLDAFNAAVSDNRADTISVSWGNPEVFYYNSLLTGGDFTGELRSFHQMFLEAAAQGQSMFAATGDSGAYDTVRALGHQLFNAPLTVDAPASDPFITAAGGTTTPFTFQFAGGPVASITEEGVWGWDYLQTYLDKVRPGRYDLFSVGGGGGVSIFWREPFYQQFTRGIKRTETNQSLIAQNPSLVFPGNTQTTPLTLLTLPGNFRGRNVPDVSLNADPETGYIVVSTADGGVGSGSGGTSFVAPQLNGISALLTESSGHRVGFWNPQIYFLQNAFGYGPWSAFNDIRAGDNWFYHGVRGYDPGAGIGTLNVTNLALFLGSGF